MIKVFFKRGAKHQNIVKEYDDALVEKRSQGSVHGLLERVRGASKSKRHNEKLKVSPMSLKRRLVLFSWS